MEKSWQTPFQIDPALLAHPDNPMWTETGLLSSHGHSDENFRWMQAFFPTRVAAKYGRAHTVFLLHFADLSFCRSRLSLWRKGYRVANPLSNRDRAFH